MIGRKDPILSSRCLAVKKGAVKLYILKPFRRTGCTGTSNAARWISLLERFRSRPEAVPQDRLYSLHKNATQITAAWSMAMEKIPLDFKKFLRLLNAEDVEYLLIGGYAVGHYGFPRAISNPWIFLLRFFQWL